MGDLYGTYRAQSPASLLHWAASAAAGYTLWVGTLLAESWAICSPAFLASDCSLEEPGVVVDEGIILLCLCQLL